MSVWVKVFFKSWVLICLNLMHMFIFVAEMECTQWPTVRWPALPRKWFWRGKSVKAAKLPSLSRQLLHQLYPRVLSCQRLFPPFFTPSSCRLKHKDGDYDGVFHLSVFISLCFIFAHSVFYYDQKNIKTSWILFPFYCCDFTLCIMKIKPWKSQLPLY